MIRRFRASLCSFLALFGVVALTTGASAQVAEFDEYVRANKCASAASTNCLEVLVFNACASGCPRSGYSFRATPGIVDLHSSLGYLKNLRNAAHAAPEATLSEGRSFGLTLSALLQQQVQMLLLAPTARFYDADRRLIEPGLMGSHTINPASFYSVTWVTGGGTAHAMPQADMGRWLVSVAMNAASSGDVDAARYYLQLSERVFRPFGIPDNEGGVRSNKRDNRCHDGLFCYWFHSFVATHSEDPSTVLNQHLHAVRDALEMHVALASWRDDGVKSGNGVVPLPGGLDPAHIGQLAEWGRGGLLQLAFAAGSSESDPSAPPSLSQFLIPAGSYRGKEYSFAAYRYEFGHSDKDDNGPREIKPANTCHYHHHSLELLAQILTLISTNPDFKDDPYFTQIYYKLVYGRPAGDTRTCTNRSSIPPSRKNMSAVPLAKLFLASMVPLTFQTYCDGVPDNDDDQPRYTDGPLKGTLMSEYTTSAEFRGLFQYAGSAEFYSESHPAREFFDAAYEGCAF